MPFCAIPAGSFLMGDELRRTETSAYEIADAPVTNAEYTAFIPRGYRERAHWSDEGWEFLQRTRIECPRFWGDPEWAQFLDPEQPVVGVSFHEAEAFARFMGARLPTEVEWERAARGDDGRLYPWGDEWRADFAAHRGGPRNTARVRAFPGNRSPFGLFDCAGNVWEWCADRFGEGDRSARGGAWSAPPEQLRCASRNGWPAEARFSHIGFRLAR